MIPYGRQTISDADIDAVVEVLRSGFLTQGPAVPNFEQAVCDYVGAKRAVAVNSGTSALHLACLALGLSKGDWLWTTPITFVASANCGLYCGAQVDFVDIDPVTWNLSIDCLKEKLEQAKQNNRLPKVLVAVHLCGLSCEMEVIHQLSEQYGFSVIEDACHAIGGAYQGAPIGSCQYSDITVFSFHPVKTMTTGEGGMAVTNSGELADKMALLRSHGITRKPEDMTRAPDGPWYYQQVELGFNYRMSDLQAALGISQLHALDGFVSRRQSIAAQYDKGLANLSLQLPHRAEHMRSAMHLYVIRVSKGTSEHSHRHIFESLREQGIGVNLHYIPVHTQPYYQAMGGYALGDFPEAEAYYAEAISIPMYPSLIDSEIDKVTQSIKNSLL